MRWYWLGVFLMALGFGALLLQQREEEAILRIRLRQDRDANRELKQLRSENLDLTSAQISEEELNLLRRDQTESVRLRREIDGLKQTVSKTEKKKNPPAAAASANAAEKELSVTEATVPMSSLKNSGTRTPAAALETVLWAATGGDIDALARVLTVDPAVRSRVEAIIAQLPEAERGKFDTAERFVAFMTAQDVPLGEAHIVEPKIESGGIPYVGVQFRDPDGISRIIGVLVRQEGTEWRLIVPAAAVEKYAAKLKSDPASEVK